MNWLLRKLGCRDRDYRCDDFYVRIDPIQREAVSVTHTRNAANLTLDGQRIGSRWEGIEVHIPQNVDAVEASQVASDLEIAFQALGYGYVIARLVEIEIVPDTERQAAIVEVHEMGYEAEVSSDLKHIRQKLRVGAARPDIQTARSQAPRMMSLLQAIHGRRQRLEILAKSKEF